MENMDNSEYSVHASRMRPPSQIGMLGRGLAELNQSENNARAKPSMLPHPQVNTNILKHKIPSAFEPEPKQRKTFAEPTSDSRQNVAAMLAPHPSIKGTSLQVAGARGPSTLSRNSSCSSSVSGRSTSHTRTTSNSSFSSSAGPGSRQPSSNFNRSQSSLASFKSNIARSNNYSRPTNHSKSNVYSRPATSLSFCNAEEEEEDNEPPRTGKRKGMNLSKIPPSIQSGCGSMRLPKSRGKSSTASLQRKASNRQISVATALSKLRLDDMVNDDPFLDAPDKRVNCPEMQASPTHKPSISSAMQSLNIGSECSNDAASKVRTSIPSTPKTPSLIPVLKAEAFKNATPAPSPTKSISAVKTPYLSKDSNVTGFTVWDTETRIDDMEARFGELKDKLESTAGVRDGLGEDIVRQKVKIVELEVIQTQLTTANVTLQAELDSIKQQLMTATTTLDDERRVNRMEVNDMRREHRNEIEDVRRKLIDDANRLIRDHRDELRDLERRKNSEQEDERQVMLRELQQAKAQIAAGNENTEVEKQRKDREIDRLRGQLENLQGELDREQTLKTNLQNNLAESSMSKANLENNVRSLRAQIDFLESGSMAQSQRFEEMEASLQAALASAKDSKEKLMREESIRRSLFNQVQELKGNIRVMCRVRPIFGQEEPDDSAAISFPDSHKESKELEVFGPTEKSSLGKETRKLNAFSFDRVFGQSSQNEEIFEEISQLVQSALDGYNVCIFCYGQTGAGKTHTMSSVDGMIPRAVKQIYETATKLQEKNWKYKMEGSFIEVYNEDLHDLLGNPKEFDKKKHEIRHDTQRKQTTVTELTTVDLDSPDKVEMILSKAMANRSVAATLSNERSSRSHSVFILKLFGTNTATGEMSEGTLNLVDLAGSERLKQSGAEGARMKETQNINKSLSCLGDVIGALGSGKEGAHIPYRNSKLTYLLQYSLGGNSKTLMFVMISPLQAHLNETLTSLKFATKVHNTHIGTAKKTRC